MKYNKIIIIMVVLIICSGWIWIKASSATEMKYTEREELQKFEWVMPLQAAQSLHWAGGYGDVFCINISGKWGLIGLGGREITPRIYDYIGVEHWLPAPEEGQPLAAGRNGMFGYIDRKGSEVIPFIYDDTQPFVGKYAVVQKSKKYSIIDTGGNVIYGPQAKEDLYPTEKPGVFAFRDGDYIGLMDEKGKVLLAADKYNWLKGYSEGAWLFTRDLKKPVTWEAYFYLDENFNPMFKDKTFGDAALFHEGLADVEIYGDVKDVDKPPKELIRTGLGYMDMDGNMMKAEIQLEIMGPFSQGMAAVVNYKEQGEGNMLSVIDREGRLIFELPRSSGYMSYQEQFSEGYMAVLNNTSKAVRSMPSGTYAYVDMQGNYVTESMFSYAGKVSGGRAVVCYDGQWGVISTENW